MEVVTFKPSASDRLWRYDNGGFFWRINEGKCKIILQAFKKIYKF